MAAFTTRAKKVASRVAKRRKPAAATFIQRSRQESSEQKAIWHQITGAGRSHVLRRFFSLTETEIATDKAALEGMLEIRLRGASA